MITIDRRRRRGLEKIDGKLDEVVDCYENDGKINELSLPIIVSLEVQLRQEVNFLCRSSRTKSNREEKLTELFLYELPHATKNLMQFQSSHRIVLTGNENS